MYLPPDQILPFWGDRLPETSSLVESCKLEKAKRGACVPSEIRPESGKFQTVALKQLMSQHGLGGSRRLDQFAFGLPIAGHLSQIHLFAPDGENAEQLPPTQLYGTDRPRFRERAAKSGKKNAQVL